MRHLTRAIRAREPSMDAIDRARAAIDSHNQDDPTSFDGEPLALAQGRRAERWAVRLQPAASAALRIATRAHHLRRWVVPRSSYPEGRAGYLRWRRDQKARQADELVAILDSVGVDPDIGQRAATMVTKRGLGSDPEVQCYEDAVSLTFIETQLRSTAERLGDDDRMVDIVARTLIKMSAAGRAAALTIDLDHHSAAIVARAVAQHAGTTTGSGS